MHILLFSVADVGVVHVAPVLIEYPALQPSCEAVSYADETLVPELLAAVDAGDSDLEANEEDVPPAEDDSVPAVVSGPIANLIPVPAALEALRNTESLAAQLKEAIERIEARKKLEAQMEENEKDIKFWENVSIIFYFESLCPHCFNCFQICSPHCRKIKMRRDGPPSDDEDDETGCSGMCCSCPIEDDEEDLDTGFMDETGEGDAEGPEVEYLASVTFQPMIPEDYNGPRWNDETERANWYHRFPPYSPTSSERERDRASAESD